MAANFGTGPLDRRHRFTLSSIAELPKGFRLSLISTIYSAVPASILVGSADLNGDGINGDLLPGTRRGSLGREVKSVDALTITPNTPDPTVPIEFTVPKDGLYGFIVIPENGAGNKDADPRLNHFPYVGVPHQGYANDKATH